MTATESDQVRKLRALAAAERREYPEYRGGFVMIFKDEICGWARDLPEATRYIPDVAAVPETGAIRWTAGGTRDTAARWSEVREPLPSVLIKGDGGAVVAAIEQLCRSERGTSAAIAFRAMLEDGATGLDRTNWAALETLCRTCRILGGNAAYKITEALPSR